MQLQTGRDSVGIQKVKWSVLNRNSEKLQRKCDT